MSRANLQWESEIDLKDTGGCLLQCCLFGKEVYG